MQITHWNEVDFTGEVKVAMLSQNASSKEISITLPKGKQMKEHKAPNAITVQVLEGEIDFEVNGAVQRLQRLDMIALEANVPHSLKAKEDSIIRLSLAQSDSAERVSAVARR